MKIDFDDIEKSTIANFKGGEKYLEANMFFDGTNRIMRARLVPGASIGLHTHSDSCEIIYILEGKGTVIYDGKQISLSAGECHYCPKDHSHTLINDSNSDLVFLGIVPKQ